MTLADIGRSSRKRPMDRRPTTTATLGAMEYLQIGAVLAIVTAIEVGLYYIDLSHDLLVALLMVLSALKFSLVVLWFMHLKFDNRLLSQFFVGGFCWRSQSSRWR